MGTIILSSLISLDGRINGPDGGIGCVFPVTPEASPPVSNVSACADAVWLETMRRIGPAPNRRGETWMRPSAIAAVTLIETGGRSRLAWSAGGAA